MEQEEEKTEGKPKEEKKEEKPKEEKKGEPITIEEALAELLNKVEKISKSI